MNRIEAAVKVLRLVAGTDYKLYTYDEVINGLKHLDFDYQIIEELDGSQYIKLGMDPDLKFIFSFENNQFMIARFNIIHTLFAEMQKYYNELDVHEYVEPVIFEQCRQELEQHDSEDIKSAAKQVAINKVLRLFNDDNLVAALMFLKYIGGADNSRISYMEHHYEPVEYRGLTTTGCVELYNLKYKRIATIDIQNCHLVDDKYELIVNAFIESVNT